MKWVFTITQFPIPDETLTSIADAITVGFDIALQMEPGIMPHEVRKIKKQVNGYLGKDITNLWRDYVAPNQKVICVTSIKRIRKPTSTT